MIKKIIKKIYLRLYTYYKTRRFKSIGEKVCVYPKAIIKNPEYISCGNRCYFGPNCRIEAWNQYNNISYKPEITFGKCVKVNSTCHIGAINRIVIGDNTLLGSHVLIIDHSHGNNDWNEMNIPPSDRNLFSKGEIVIGKNCWIAENAVVLPGVHIGDYCTIGASAVVTKDIPAYSVVAGNPARVVKSVTQ